VPQLLFSEVCASFFVLINFLEEVTTVSAFHDNAQTVGSIFKETFLEANDIGVVNRSQNSDFIDCIFLFFSGKLSHFDFLHGVLDIV
jgi:hypothetical protein